jgi:uncharacterized phage protein gp47/JayE
MPLVFKTVATLNRESLLALQSYTSTTMLQDGTIAKALLRAINILLGEVHDNLEVSSLGRYLSTATGGELDYIGEMLNCPRGGAAIASGANIQKFYVNTGTLGDLPGIGTLSNIIPAGTIVSSTDGVIQYQVMSSVGFANSDTQVITSIEAFESGFGYNIGPNVLRSHNLGVTGLLTTNIDNTTGGTNIQDDDEYRYMLSKAVTKAEAANETAVRLAALSAAGVSTIYLIPYQFGVGSYNVIVIGNTPVTSDAVLLDVLTRIRKVTALGEFCYVSAPRYMGIELTAHLEFKSNLTTVEKDTLSGIVEQAIYDYINNIPLGQSFIKNELIQRIMDVSDNILDVITDPSNENNLRTYIWYPTTTLFDPNTGITSSTRVREEFTGNYNINYFDDKMVIEQDMQGFTHPATFQAVTITWE